MKRLSNRSNKALGFLTWWSMLTDDNKRMYECFIVSFAFGNLFSVTEYFGEPGSYSNIFEAILEGCAIGAFIGMIVYPVGIMISRFIHKKRK